MYLPTKIIIIIIVHTEQLLSSATFKFQLVSILIFFFPTTTYSSSFIQVIHFCHFGNFVT